MHGLIKNNAFEKFFNHSFTTIFLGANQWLQKQIRVPEKYELLWVTDFPLLEWSSEDGRWYSMHHPFTSPLDEDMDKLESDPGAVRAKAYDLVLNGSGIGGGSIRIHAAEMQARIFKRLGISDEEAKLRFGFFLEALKVRDPPARRHRAGVGPYHRDPGQ